MKLYFNFILVFFLSLFINAQKIIHQFSLPLDFEYGIQLNSGNDNLRFLGIDKKEDLHYIQFSTDFEVEVSRKIDIPDNFLKDFSISHVYYDDQNIRIESINKNFKKGVVINLYELDLSSYKLSLKKNLLTSNEKTSHIKILDFKETRFLVSFKASNNYLFVHRLKEDSVEEQKLIADETFGGLSSIINSAILDSNGKNDELKFPSVSKYYFYENSIYFAGLANEEAIMMPIYLYRLNLDNSKVEFKLIKEKERYTRKCAIDFEDNQLFYVYQPEVRKFNLKSVDLKNLTQSDFFSIHHPSKISDANSSITRTIFKANKKNNLHEKISYYTIADDFVVYTPVLSVRKIKDDYHMTIAANYYAKRVSFGQILTASLVGGITGAFTGVGMIPSLNAKALIPEIEQLDFFVNTENKTISSKKPKYYDSKFSTRYYSNIKFFLNKTFITNLGSNNSLGLYKKNKDNYYIIDFSQEENITSK